MLARHSSPPAAGASGDGPQASEHDALLCSLVRRYLLLAQVPASEWSRNESALLLLARSLLASSLAPAANVSTESAAIVAIRRHILRNNTQGELSNAARFSETVLLLQQNFPNRRLWAMLCFLLRVAEKSGTGSSSGQMADILGAPSAYSKPLGPALPTAGPATSAEKPQAEYWRQYLELKGRMAAARRRDLTPVGLAAVPEQVLLRDLVFVLQGIEGTLVRLCGKTGNFVLQAPAPAPVRLLVDRIAECGTVYYQIKRATSSIPNAGAFRQSLLLGIAAELREYLRLVACFEASVASGDSHVMSLRKASVWFDASRTLLDFLYTLIRETSDHHGGPLVSIVSRYQSHGEPAIAAAATRLLLEILQPFCSMLTQFVRNGTLQDRHKEFFIVQSPSPNGTKSHESWTSKFSLDARHIPTILPSALAAKVLLAGKTRSFLASMQDGDRMDLDEEADAEESMSVDEQGKATGWTVSTNLDDIKEMIKREHLLACQSLSHLLSSRYQMMEHLKCIRDFIHFGRGDFAAALMDFISALLSKPAGSLFRHALVSCLDQVLLSIPQKDTRLDVRKGMEVRLHDATNPKLLGWDVFTLDYKTEFPLDVILTPHAMAEHVKLSHFLWSLRRVHHVMAGCWSRIASMQKATGRGTEAGLDLKRLQIFIQEGSAFARQLCCYATSIVQKCWDRFFQALEKAGTQTFGLDSFIQAHDGLLLELRDSLFVFSNPQIKSKLATVLSVLLRAETVCKGFERYLALLAEHESREKGDATLRHRSGSWVRHGEDEQILESFGSNQLRLLSEQRAAFQHCARQFQTELDELLLQLQKESASALGKHPIAQLVLMIDYNGYHQRRNGFDQRKYCYTSK